MADGRSAPFPADAALVAAVAGGSEDALAALYDRHAPGIHATALRLTGDRGIADDVVQEVFLALWNRAERFDPAIGSLAAWLGTIARNRAVDRLRAASRRPQLVALGRTGDEGSADEALERAAHRRARNGLDGGDPVAVLDAAEARAAISDALAAMPDPEREVILLAYRDELSQSEIAGRLGWPLGTVKTRTRRALARLRAALADTYGPALAPVPVDGSSTEPTEMGARRGSGG
ncbi:MAG TPA: sigma-70 family RNA polymerase sigma factor, partial [Candidatus Nanopelagicales bacterium]|nr:sigma-70 family RNA polymerase sigma factor [Candidatus Nanopelagicales bacterium]